MQKWRNLGKSGIFLCLLAIVTFVSGCGGGGGGSSAGGTASPAGSGIAVDPYIVGAVFQEVSPEGNVLQESAPSDESGVFNFENPFTSGSLVCSKPGMQGIHNDLPYGGILCRKVDGAGPLVVSPLTTLLANGMASSEVVALLDAAGLPGMTVEALYADPMAGLEGAAEVGEKDLLSLRAALAVNALMEVRDNYRMNSQHVQSDREELAELVRAVKIILNPETFRWVASAPVGEVRTASVTPPINFGHFLRAAVSITDAVVAKKKANASVDSVSEANQMLEVAPKLALFYYVQENRGRKEIEDAIASGKLPNAEKGQVPVIEEGTVVENTPPVADAGQGQSVQVGQSVALSGAASRDADGQPLTYSWSIIGKPAGSDAFLGSPASATTAFTADIAGVYSVQLVVNDGKTFSAPSVVTITVTAKSPAPVEPSEPVPAPTPVNYAAPVLNSVQVNGTSWVLSWSVPGGTVPAGGYDIFVDGVNTNTANRTTQMSANISGLTAGVQHCFQVEGRYLQANPAQYIKSNQVCATPTATTPTPPPVVTPPTSPSVGGVLAFPGAEGFGANAKGGRGGQVIKVTNLNASGAGSLRAALEASGPRIVVFEVSGQINLGSSTISIKNPYITIAGQTAPSPGITIQGGLSIRTHNVIMQHLRVRGGSSGPADVVQIYGGGASSSSIYNIVIDHCSISWPNGDENLSTIAYIRDVTVSNSLVSETTHGATGGFLVGNYTYNFTMVRNLMAHNNARNPRIDWQAGVAAVNNIAYNTSSSMFALGDGGGGTSISIVGNKFINGPSTPSGKYFITSNSGIAGTNKFYAADNVYPYGYISGGGQPYVVSTPPVSYKNVTVQPTSTLESYLLPRVGARPADRDAVDSRVINDVKNRRGAIISSESSVGGFPSLARNTRAFNPGSNPNGDDDGDGYTNVEEILHQMAAEIEGTF